MNQKTPPLQAIQAFVTAVHAPSFRVAADVLALSPSALSRRIATLERYLGGGGGGAAGLRCVASEEVHIEGLTEGMLMLLLERA